MTWIFKYTIVLQSMQAHTTNNYFMIPSLNLDVKWSITTHKAILLCFSQYYWHGMVGCIVKLELAFLVMYLVRGRMNTTRHAVFEFGLNVHSSVPVLSNMSGIHHVLNNIRMSTVYHWLIWSFLSIQKLKSCQKIMLLCLQLPWFLLQFPIPGFITFIFYN